MSNVVRIATRESQLAMWQANHVKSLLLAAHPGLECEIVGMTTQGDRNKVTPLGQMGGKGVFVKELETALLDGSVDIAVHSMKDVPGELPPGLGIAAIAERADPRDAFVCNDFSSLADLPAGSVVGSSSLRRVLQLEAAYPSLSFKDLRGNIDTRLAKLDAGDYHAIILAVAGLVRLGQHARVTTSIAAEDCLPAAGQGAVGIESRQDDNRVLELLAAINHSETYQTVTAERRVTLALGATCNLPVAVFATLAGPEMLIRAFVANTEGSEVITEQISGSAADALTMADNLGQQLLARGAARLMGQA